MCMYMMEERDTHYDLHETELPLAIVVLQLPSSCEQQDHSIIMIHVHVHMYRDSLSILVHI